MNLVKIDAAPGNHVNMASGELEMARSAKALAEEIPRCAKQYAARLAAMLTKLILRLS